MKLKSIVLGFTLLCSSFLGINAFATKPEKTAPARSGSCADTTLSPVYTVLDTVKTVIDLALSIPGTTLSSTSPDNKSGDAESDASALNKLRHLAKKPTPPSNGVNVDKF